MTQIDADETGLIIRRTRVRALELVPERPVETAAGTLSTVPLVLIDLVTGEGVTGCSYLRCYTPLALPATARLVEDLAETIGGSARAPDRINDGLRARFRLLGLQGLVGMAIAGLEMAAWDALAKARELPLVELLGGDRVKTLDGEGLTWIEEPTRAEDYRGHATIAAAADTPIQLGESWWGPEEMEKSIAAGASDQVTLDVMKLGGVRGWLTAAELAAQTGLPASSHTFPELSVHLLALTPTCRRLEYLDHAGPILTEPVRVSGGLATAPDRPGAGLEWDEEQVKRWLVS
jgi:L-alanine-DL-glutamate epimerase-like enolase superfamily enzyme